jgi:hypothetical protein
MNVTALLLTAAATNRALQLGVTTDPAIIALTDTIFAISGADPCAFDACANGTRTLYGSVHAPTGLVDGIVLGTITPASYNHTLYGDFFGWCRDFMRSYPPAPAFSAALVACNASAVTSLVARATWYRSCARGPIECMCAACNISSSPLKRARQAAESVEAALVRRLQDAEDDLERASKQITQYWADKRTSKSTGSGSPFAE